MKKNILFFLWLVIGSNVFAMEEKDDQNPLEKEFQQLLRLLGELPKQFTIDPADLVSFLERKKEQEKNQRDTSKIAENPPKVDEQPDVQKEKNTVPKSNFSDQPNVIIKTKWKEFGCLEEALLFSREFQLMITKAQQKQMPFEINIDDDYGLLNDHRASFELMLSMLHNKFDDTVKISPLEILEFINLCKIFGCDEKIMKPFLATNLLNIKFSSEEVLASLDDPRFTTHRDIYFLQKILPYLPPWGMEYFLKTPSVRTDSENSLFYLLIAWVNEQPASTAKNFFEPMLQHIRWKDITLEYLVNIVRSIADAMNIPLFDDYYELAVHLKLLDSEQDDIKKNELREKINWLASQLKYSLDLETHKKAHKSSANSLAIKAHFQDVADWKIGDKYYSAGMLSKGYFWYLFLEPQRSEETGLSTLANFMRCSIPSQAIGKHYLPVNLTVTVLCRNGEKRKFSPMEIEYTDFTKCVGGKVSLDESPVGIVLKSPDVVHQIKLEILETWEDIKNGKSIMVNPDKSIIMIASIDYKPLSKEKIAEFLDPKFWQLGRKYQEKQDPTEQPMDID